MEEMNVEKSRTLGYAWKLRVAQRSLWIRMQLMPFVWKQGWEKKLMLQKVRNQSS